MEDERLELTTGKPQPKLRRAQCFAITFAIVIFAAVVGGCLGILFGLNSRKPPAPLLDNVQRIVDAALNNEIAYQRLGYLCDRFGGRPSGSVNLENAIQWIYNTMLTNDSLDAYLENVTVGHWVRGNESAALISPFYRRLPMLSLGGSTGTAPDTLVAEAIVVRSFDELYQRSSEVNGKVVVYNAAWNQSYGNTVRYRSIGAVEAKKFGAVGVMIRSVTYYSLQTPHTGTSASAGIPAVAITVEDAELLQRLQDRGEKLVVQIYSEARKEDNTTSYNVIAELKGREKPDEVVVIGGHIDSWDAAQGAQDDGGGIAIAWETVRLLKELNIIPRRTIRCVMWVDEENGGAGSRTYFENHKHVVDKHIAAIESDSGVFKPTGFSFTGNKQALEYLKTNVVEPYLASLLDISIWEGGGAADISPLIDAGVPGFSQTNDAISKKPWKYFDIHHTAADTFDKIDHQELNQNLAAMAVLSYVLAELEDPLPR